MKNSRIPLRNEVRDTLKLAWPIVLTQVGHVSMGLVDTLVAGHISTTALAGLGLAANFYWTFTGVCIGCLFALDTYFSQAAGAKDARALERYFGQSFWLSGFLSLLAVVIILGGHWFYLASSEPSATRVVFAQYVEVIIWCLPSLFLFFVLQRYWQAQGRVLPFTFIIIGANILNLLGCFALGLGWWGFPRMEVKGIAVCTVICRYAMLLAAAIYTWRHHPKPALTLPPLDRGTQRQFLKLGLPAAGHVSLEVGAFGLATVLVSLLGAVPLAAHHVCLMMAAFTFMFPLGFSSAAAVRVGNLIGAGEPDRARLAGWICIGLSVTVMSLFALGYLTLPRMLLSWFTNDAAVIEVGVKILLLVAIFEVADGIQVCTTGALRGAGNTRAAMVANLIGYYPIGLTLGVTLCFGFKVGVVGMWIGLAAGLISVATMLLLAWRWVTRDLARLRPVNAAAGFPQRVSPELGTFNQ